MIASRKYAAALLATLASVAAAVFSIRAQPQAPTSPTTQSQSSPVSVMNHNLVLLDPAHGGSDTGATIGDQVVEKDITLAIAAKLRATLAAAGFTVITTRDSDLPDPLTPDQRAETANRAHAVACIVLHSTRTGSGVHLYTSTLPPADLDQSADPDSPPAFVPIPWESAQAGFVTQSQHMAADLNSALAQGNLPVLVGKASVRPLDNLMCPAVTVEIAPLANPGSDATPVTNATYQQRVVDALTAALKTWRTHADPPSPQATSDDPTPQSNAASRAVASAEATGRTAAQNHTQRSSQIPHADQKVAQ